MPESKRLFFAIELPTPLQRQIVRWRADHFPPEAGRPVAAANLHLTLAFLGLLQLANMLRAQAARSGCYQSPQPFHPHITLLRDAGQAVAIPPPGFHWAFQVNTFALYESVFIQGRTRYTPLQRWTLGDTDRNSDEV